MNQGLRYAGRLERLFAYLIDSIILVVPSVFLVSIFNGAPFVILISFLASMGYYVYFTASYWQGTPGKRLLGLYVTHSNRQPLTVRDALERFIIFTIPGLPFYASFIPVEVMPILSFWLSVFWFGPILFTPERVGLHDRLCNTRVLTGKAL